MSKITLGLVALLFLVGSASFVRAESLEIVGNGAGSTNGINVQGTNTNTNTQSNDTNYQNNIDAKANSGGNSATGNSGGNTVIKTGDTSVTVNVNNQGGGNTAKVDNCCDDKKPSPTPTKKPSQTPTPTPGNGGSNGGGNGGSSSGGVGGGGSDPKIIGLSKTSGEDKLIYLFYTGGLICLGYAGKLFKRS